MRKFTTKIAISIDFTNSVSGPKTVHRRHRLIKLTVIVSNVHLFYVLFVGLGLDLGTDGLDYKTGCVLYSETTFFYKRWLVTAFHALHHHKFSRIRKASAS